MDRIDVLLKLLLPLLVASVGIFGRMGCNIENLSDDGSY